MRGVPRTGASAAFDAAHVLAGAIGRAAWWRSWPPRDLRAQGCLFSPAVNVGTLGRARAVGLNSARAIERIADGSGLAPEGRTLWPNGHRERAGVKLASLSGCFESVRFSGDLGQQGAAILIKRTGGQPAGIAARSVVPRRRRAAGGSAAQGLLVVLVGPDGRGKEMIVNASRRRFATDASLEFPLPVITRAPEPGQEHVGVSRRDFRDIDAQGGFFASWEANGRHVGLPKSVLASLALGRIVVVAASEDAVQRAREAGAQLKVVEVTSGPDAASAWMRRATARLAGRRVASDPESGKDSAVHRIAMHHSGDLADAVRRFHGLLHSLRIERLQSPLSAKSRTKHGLAIRTLAPAKSAPRPAKARRASRKSNS